MMSAPFQNRVKTQRLKPPIFVHPFCEFVHPIPTVSIVIEGDTGATKTTQHSFSLQDLRTKFPRRALPVTFTCTGNRRGEFNALRKTDGLPWWIGSISNAVWGGALLYDVLRACGVTEDELEKRQIEHAQFLGIEGYEVFGHTALML